MLYFPGEFKDQNVSNVTVYINLNTTDTLHGVSKAIARLIPHIGNQIGQILPYIFKCLNC